MLEAIVRDSHFFNGVKGHEKGCGDGQEVSQIHACFSSLYEHVRQTACRYDFQGGHEELLVLDCFELNLEELVGQLLHLFDLLILQGVGADFSLGSEAFLSESGHFAQLPLGSSGFLDNAFSEEINREDRPQNEGKIDGQRQEFSADVEGMKKEGKGADEGQGLLDEVIRYLRDGGLHILCIGDQAADEVSALLLFVKGKGEYLQAGKDIHANSFQHFKTDVVDQESVDQHGDAANHKDSGHHQAGGHENGLSHIVRCDEGGEEIVYLGGDLLVVENNGEDLRNHEGDTHAAGSGNDNAGKKGGNEGSLDRFEICEVLEKFFEHERGLLWGLSGSLHDLLVVEILVQR